ncbi:MAG: hypothetical protein MZU97_13710 [Bacillus subtilis]|nr:hypothetical protein [Bacillus subtilis]
MRSIIIVGLASGKKHVGKIRNLEVKIREANLLSKRLRQQRRHRPLLPARRHDHLRRKPGRSSGPTPPPRSIFSNILVERKISFVHEGLSAMVQKREGKFHARRLRQEV